MKQHISSDDLEQLSEKGRERIVAFLNKNPVTGKIPPSDFLWDIHPSQLTIGQMIEFLIDETGFNLDYSGYDWGVMIGEYEKGGRELCDALWEAVKEVLEREE